MILLPATPKPSHVAYADESQYNSGRHRGIALVTAAVDGAIALQHELQWLLLQSDLAEFKWRHLDGVKRRFAAVKMLDCAVRAVLGGRVRVDVLTWDVRDSRHDLRGRDDIANLHRMYYHLFKNVLSQRWPRDSTWALYPDRNTAIDWPAIADFLAMASIRADVSRDIFTTGGLGFVLKREFRIVELTPRVSREESLIQLADLFVGMAVYSRARFDRYESWRQTLGPQPALFQDQTQPATVLSAADRERCQVLEAFDQLCKKHRLGVSLRTRRGLRTPHPRQPLNFWWYEPQSEADKAPVRARSQGLSLGSPIRCDERLHSDS
jgi:hypothetical protein